MRSSAQPGFRWVTAAVTDGAPSAPLADGAPGEDAGAEDDGPAVDASGDGPAVDAPVGDGPGTVVLTDDG